mmetsp:Transcript_18542/g.55925  ORF Transcript_18542/g.55925 Transcript_18542/m.55925 type:complete len:374 (+) Transcript_18542:1966-3087(+)
MTVSGCPIMLLALSEPPSMTHHAPLPHLQWQHPIAGRLPRLSLKAQMLQGLLRPAPHLLSRCTHRLRPWRRSHPMKSSSMCSSSSSSSGGRGMFCRTCPPWIKGCISTRTCIHSSRCKNLRCLSLWPASLSICQPHCAPAPNSNSPSRSYDNKNSRTLSCRSLIERTTRESHLQCMPPHHYHTRRLPRAGSSRPGALPMCRRFTPIRHAYRLRSPLTAGSSMPACPGSHVSHRCRGNRLPPAPLRPPASPFHRGSRKRPRRPACRSRHCSEVPLAPTTAPQDLSPGWAWAVVRPHPWACGLTASQAARAASQGSAVQGVSHQLPPWGAATAAGSPPSASWAWGVLWGATMVLPAVGSAGQESVAAPGFTGATS